MNLDRGLRLPLLGGLDNKSGFFASAWTSDKFPLYPIELTFNFKETTNCSRLHLRFVEARQPSRLQLFSGEYLSGLVKQTQVKPSGTVRINLSKPAVWIRLVMHKPTQSQNNKYQQVALNKIQAFGEADEYIDTTSLVGQIYNANIAASQLKGLAKEAIRKHDFSKAIERQSVRSRVQAASDRFNLSVISTAQQLKRAREQLNESMELSLQAGEAKRIRIKSSIVKELNSQSSFMDQQVSQPIVLNKFCFQQSLLQRRHLSLMDLEGTESKLKLLGRLVDRLKNTKKLTKIETELAFTVIVLCLQVDKAPTLSKYAIKAYAFFVKKFGNSRHFQQFKSMQYQTIRSLLAKVFIDEVKQEAITAITLLFQNDYGQLVEVLLEMAAGATQEHLFALASLALVLQEQVKFNQLLLSPLKLMLLGHPSRKLRFSLNRLFNREGKVCEFCGLQRQNLGEKKDYIWHLKNECIMLVECYQCRQLSQAPQMHLHLEKAHGVKGTGRCFYCRIGPINARAEWLNHLLHCSKAARGLPPGPQML